MLFGDSVGVEIVKAPKKSENPIAHASSRECCCENVFLKFLNAFRSLFSLSARKKSLASGKCLNESLRSDFNETYNFADYVAAPGVLLARELPRGGEIYRLLERFLMENVFHSQELPHKRVVRNVRKMLETKPSRLELENLLTSLPRGSRPKRNYDDDSD